MLQTARRETDPVPYQPVPSPHTLSIMVGNAACNAQCGFCTTKMEPSWRSQRGTSEVNWLRFDAIIEEAAAAGVRHVQLTGAGEPTLFLDEIVAYVTRIQKLKPVTIELQTNGITFGAPQGSDLLSRLKSIGVTSIALSMVHYDSQINAQVYTPNRPTQLDLVELLQALKWHGFSVRLGCTLLSGYIDSVEEVAKLLDFAASNHVDQVTLRPVRIASEALPGRTAEWCARHLVSERRLAAIEWYLGDKGVHLGTLPQGGDLFSIMNQTVCFLPQAVRSEHRDRRLIFFADGRVHSDWG